MRSRERKYGRKEWRKEGKRDRKKSESNDERKREIEISLPLVYSPNACGDQGWVSSALGTEPIARK